MRTERARNGARKTDRWHVSFDNDQMTFETGRSDSAERLQRMERADRCSKNAKRAKNIRTQRATGVKDDAFAQLFLAEGGQLCHNLLNSGVGHGDQDYPSKKNI